MAPENRLHVILDGTGAPPERLDDPSGIEQLLRRAVGALGGKILHLHVHAFDPQGVTAFALLAESHMAIHTWPETGQFAADLFFCGSVALRSAVEEIRAGLLPAQMRVREIERVPASGPAPPEPMPAKALRGPP